MKYSVTIETLSPLHIGTGTELLKDFDYVSTRGRTYVINQDAVYGAEFDQRGGEARLSLPPSHLVSEDQWQEGSPLVRYTVQGSTSIEQIHEQIKDVHGCCYLPGSSLKGALRTGLLAHAALSGGLEEAEVNYRQGRDGNFVKEFAAENFERTLFRPLKNDPNHDLLRTLHVFDSQPMPAIPSRMMLCLARVFTGGEPTLRDDLPELVAHAQRNGQITGLNTNGRRLASRKFIEELVEAGLDHVQEGALQDAVIDCRYSQDAILARYPLGDLSQTEFMWFVCVAPHPGDQVR